MVISSHLISSDHTTPHIYAIATLLYSYQFWRVCVSRRRPGSWAAWWGVASVRCTGRSHPPQRRGRLPWLCSESPTAENKPSSRSCTKLYTDVCVRVNSVQRYFKMHYALLGRRDAVAHCDDSGDDTAPHGRTNLLIECQVWWHCLIWKIPPQWNHHKLCCCLS